MNFCLFPHNYFWVKLPKRILAKIRKLQFLFLPQSIYIIFTNNDLFITIILCFPHLTVVQPGTAPVHMLAVKGQDPVVVFGVLKQNYSLFLTSLKNPFLIALLDMIMA
jgi:hypothetical protein